MVIEEVDVSYEVTSVGVGVTAVDKGVSESVVIEEVDVSYDVISVGVGITAVSESVVIEELDVSYEVTSVDVGVTAVFLIVKEVDIGYNCFESARRNCWQFSRNCWRGRVLTGSTSIGWD